MWKSVLLCFFLLALSPALSKGEGVGCASLDCCGSGNDTIYTNVDKIPQFDGGRRGWNGFLNRNLDVPMLQRLVDEDFYKEYGWVQRALLEFTVCEDGRVCDISVINADKLPEEFVNEVVRVMGKSPRWKPAERGGRPVKTRFRQPMTVNLKG